ncbi:MAG: head-tail adaptor protein [Rhizobiales bacterium]|jgi:hypothetical protein|nr:head-tail adaptor protein [Hyphomicrobiales bacterium]
MTAPRDLDVFLQFRRRKAVDAGAGNNRGDYEDWFSCWGSYRDASARERDAYGVAEDIVAGVLTVRESSLIALVTNAARVVIGGADHGVTSVPLADRSGFRKLRVERKMG